MTKPKDSAGIPKEPLRVQVIEFRGYMAGTVLLNIIRWASEEQRLILNITVEPDKNQFVGLVRYLGEPPRAKTPEPAKPQQVPEIPFADYGDYD